MTKYKNQLSKWFPYRNGSYQEWDNLADKFRSSLKQEDGFTTIFQGFRYTVEKYRGKWAVFRTNLNNTLEMYVYSHPCLELHRGLE